MGIGHILQMIWILYLMVMAANVFWIMPYIEKKTEYKTKRMAQVTYSLSKKFRWWILFFGVFMLFFFKRIRRIRKEKHYELHLQYLKRLNPHKRFESEILSVERWLKLNRLKKKKLVGNYYGNYN